jgi:hypothetical protein
MRFLIGVFVVLSVSFAQTPGVKPAMAMVLSKIQPPTNRVVDPTDTVRCGDYFMRDVAKKEIRIAFVAMNDAGEPHFRLVEQSRFSIIFDDESNEPKVQLVGDPENPQALLWINHGDYDRAGCLHPK